MKPLVLSIVLIAAYGATLFGDSSLPLGALGPPQRKIIIGTELDYPPYSFLNADDSADGLNVELVRAISAEMGLEVEIEIGPWNRIRRSLEEGRIDAVVGMFYSAQRDSIVDFTVPYTYVGYAPFFPKGSPAPKEPDDFSGSRIIVMKDDIMHDYVRKQELTESIISTGTVREALHLLARGQGDYALLPKLPGEHWKSVMRLEGVLKSGALLEREPYCIAVKEGDTELASILGEGLAVLQNSGELNRISDNWLGVLEGGVRARTFVLVVGGILLLALTAAAVLALWFHTLRNQVRRRTADLRREIQQRIEAENAARNEEARFRRLFEHSNDAIFIHTTEGKVLEVNDRACAMTGYTREELCATPLLKLHPAVDYGSGEDGLKETLEKGNARFETRMLQKNGTLIDAEVSARLVDAKNGIIQGVVRDITERRKHEKLLRENEERFRLYVSHSPTAIFLADAQGNYTYANPAACSLIGFSYEEILEQNIETLTHEDGREQALAAFGRLSEEENAEIETTMRKKDGGKVDILIQAAKLSPNQYIGFCTDITLRKQAEKNMRTAKEAAEDANRAKSEFLANMSHEIRTPMNGIIGMTELALTTTNEDERKEYLQTVQSSAHSLLVIINEILDFSKIEAGKIKLSPAPFDIKELTEEVTDLLSGKAREKGLTVKRNISSDETPSLHGDSLRIRQILTNLLGNAIKFTDEGSITVALAVTPVANNGKHRITLEVHDTGIGIPEAVLDDIFDSFNQGKTSYLRSQGGTGLGLTISKKLAELMGGSLQVESTVGAGSRFRLTLELEKYEGPHGEKSSSKAHSNARPAKYRGRVLVAEDNPVNIKFTEVLLKQHGIEPVIVTNGEDAVTRVAEEEFDLVFMDVQMPKLDGYEATRRIRAGGHGAVPVVAMTAYAMEEDRRTATEAGMTDYITKPVDRADIVRILNTYLSAG